MDQEKPERRIAGVHVVMVGDFNPAILHPSWLAAKNLISGAEAEAAEVEVVARELCMFRAEWLRLRVEPHRFEASTSNAAYYLPLRDLVVGLFEVLEHTPVRRLGINYLQHFEMPSEGDWHALGDRLVPKEPWEGLIEGGRERADGRRLPGLKSLTIEGQRPGSAATAFNIKVEPSKRVNNGVYIETNEDFAAEGQDALRELLQVVRSSWGEALEFAEGVALGLLTGREPEDQ